MGPTEHIFGGRYKIIGEVGRGGMGVIYRGVDSILDREVAIKVMSADFAETSDEARTRFFREAKAAARLQHRNIVTVFEFAEQDGIPYIVMEFLKGRSLSARMKALPPLTLDQKLDIMTELCNGLQFAHENGVIHRDVKPANVWILEDGTVKLVDFGIAKVASSMMTIRGDVMGSASYMSPEQIEGQPVTGQSDVFSAAVVLYEIVARRRPFEGDSPTATMMQIVQGAPPPIESIVPDLPRELVDAINKGLEKDPENRFRTAGDFGAELQLIRMSLPREEETYLQPSREPATSTLQFKAEPIPSQTTTVPNRWSSTGRPGIWIGAAAGVLAVLVALVIWMNRSPAATPVTTPAPAGAAAATGQTGGSGTTTGGGAGPSTPSTKRPVQVVSNPPEARVSVEGAGAKPSNTPATLLLAAGDTIRIEKRGYEPRRITLTDADLQSATLTYELRAVEAAVVQVQIEGEYVFEVRDGTRVLSPASEKHTLQVKDGAILRLRAPEYFLNDEITVSARGARSVTYKAPGLAHITLSGSELCQVIIDGRPTDHYLRQALPPIAAGDHEFSFTCSDNRPLARRRISLNPGQNPTQTIR